MMIGMINKLIILHLSCFGEKFKKSFRAECQWFGDVYANCCELDAGII